MQVLKSLAVALEGTFAGFPSHQRPGIRQHLGHVLGFGLGMLEVKPGITQVRIAEGKQGPGGLGPHALRYFKDAGAREQPEAMALY